MLQSHRTEKNNHHKITMKKIFLFLSSFILVFTGISGTLSAVYSQDYYVDKDSTRATCSDTNSGTLEKPFCTIQKAVQVAEPGTRIHLMTGTYEGGVTISSLNGSAEAPITFTSYEGDRVLLDGQKKDIVPLDITDSSYLIFDKIEVTNGHSIWNGGIRIKRGSNNQITHSKIYNNQGSNTSGILITGSHHNVIDNNEVHNNGLAGIFVNSVAGPSYENIISNNTVHDNILGQGNADGIELVGADTYNNQIIGNTIYNNGDDGLDTWTSRQNLVKNNISYGHVNPDGDGNGFKLGGSKDGAVGGGNTIIGNLSYNNKYNGFVSNGNPGNKYYFNVAYGNQNFGFENGWEGGACTENCTTEYMNNIGLNNTRGNFNIGAYQTISHNNIWFDSSTNSPKVFVDYTMKDSLESFSEATGGLDNPNNGSLSSISANPMFVNVNEGDFHILSGSPAIDKGTEVNGITNDHEGNSRPQGNGYDIGAFELDTKAPILAEVSPVSSPANDTTPDYVFSSDESGTITYGGSCSSSKTDAVTGDNTITLNVLSEGIYGDCTVSVTDASGNVSSALNMTTFKISFEGDTIPPILAEVTPIPYPTNDTTPDYVFNSNEPGSITYGGSCSSSTTDAVDGDNTITLNTITEGIYGDCTITVTDAAGNISDLLEMSTFKISNDTPPAEDTIPDQFTFTDITDATRDTTYISNPISVTGIDTGVTVTITGGEYRINAGNWTNQNSIVNEGDIIEVKVQSDKKNKETVSATLDINGVSDTYSVTT